MADIQNNSRAEGWDNGPAFPDTRYMRFFRKFSEILGWICLALAGVGMVDTLASLAFAHEVHAHFLDTLPHEPLPILFCFMVAGSTPVIARHFPHTPPWLFFLLGASVIGVAILTTDASSGFPWTLETASGWVMSLIGFSVAASGSRLAMTGYVRQFAIFAIFLICGMAVVTQMYNFDSEAGVPGIGISWLSAGLGLIAAHALLFQSPGFGVMRLLSGNGFGCQIMRKLLPSAIALLASLGWLLSAGEHWGWYPPTFGESLYTTLAIFGFSGILLFTAASLNRLDAERRERENEIRRDRSQLQAILDHATAIVCLKDLEGRYLLVNQSFARAAGKARPEDCIGKSARELFPENAARAAEADYRTVLQQRTGVESVSRFDLPDGTARHLLTARFPILDANGEPYALCGIYTDITEIKVQEEEIQRLNASLRERTRRQEAANSELEAFSYSVSHDLRAPLRHITGFGQLLAQRNRETLDEKSRHYLDVIQTSVGRMGALIDDLLSFSRASKVEVVPKRVRMSEMVSEIRAELDAHQKDVAVSWELGALPDAHGDPAMLRLVWNNLLSNAVKYSSKNPAPRILVGWNTENEEGVPAYFVRDNGAGFDMRYSDKLFGVFQRLHSTQEYEGTGIGLAMVRRILERHGGRIWAKAAPGEGACFYFVLPEPEATPRSPEGKAVA